ncbi:hypothetical protein [Salinibacter grassmerensis]|nr:hypothetical protein [Salinibacter grassmerensis]
MAVLCAGKRIDSIPSGEAQYVRVNPPLASLDDGQLTVRRAAVQR